jgi:DNA-binding MarR family transcriptional regulator
MESLHPSDRDLLAFLAGRATTTSSELASARYWTRTYAATRLRGLERRGYAHAELGKGGRFVWTPTAEGKALIQRLTASARG